MSILFMFLFTISTKSIILYSIYLRIVIHEKIKATAHFDLNYLSNEIINIICANIEITATIVNLPIQVEQISR